MTLYTHETGPFVGYDGKFLRVEDLNPHIETKWRMSRLALVTLAFRALLAAVRGY